MKLVIVCQVSSHSKERPFGQGGTDTQIAGLAESLSNLGHEVYVAGNFIGDFEASWVNSSDFEYVDAGIKDIPDEKIGELVSAPLVSYILRGKLEDINPDGVILTGRYTSVFLTNTKSPCVFVAHNPDAMNYYKEYSIKNNILNYIQYPIKNIIENRVMNNCDCTVSLNSLTSDYLSSHEIQNVQIPNGIRINEYKDRGDHGYLLYAGGLRYVKNVDSLIKAYKMVPEPKPKLLIVGSGPEKDSLENIVNELNLQDKVVFEGLLPKDKFIQVLSMCTAFILPSSFEMMSVTLLEAMACYKPVIASDIPGSSDIIDHGKNGYIFRQGNIEDLADKIKMVIGNYDTDIVGQNARKTVEENYSFKAIAKEYEKLVTSLS